MAHVGSIRGLSQYIKKIRAASTQEERDAIVQSELAKIRQKYSSSKKVSAYDRKKYTWKLLYSHMMGYDVDFGHKQAADLIPSNNFEEKQVGYQALTILLNEEDEFMMLPVNNVMKDLGSRNELFVSLSLCFAGSVAGPEMSSAIAQAVITAVMNQRLSEHCRKKAALCLLRIYHKLPDEAGLITPETWADNFLKLFSSAMGTGMHLALCALLLGVIERQGPSGYEKLQPVLVNNLTSVVAGHGAFGDCLYYGIPSPWLQCKYLRLLAMMPPDENSGLRAQLETPLRHACEQSVPSGKSNQNPAYARTAVLTEAAQLCLQIDRVQLLSSCLAKMTSLIERKDPNTRFIALSTLCTLCETADMASALQPVLPQVVGCLSDSDPGVKKRAIDLLVNVCDRSSVEQVSAQLLRQLPLASAEVRGDLVVKVAILAERYAPSLSWYIQTMLALMDLGSEEVSDDVWFRAVQAVAGSTDDRPSTTEAIAKSLESGSLSVPLVSTAGYVLSEFADQVPDRSPAQLAEELTPRLALAPVATQGLLLTALMKLRMHAPQDMGLKRHVEEIFTEYAADANTDIQQRAVEYLAYSKMGDNTVVRQELFAPMPEWQDKVMLFSQPSQEFNGQSSGIKQQEGAFAEAAAAEGASDPADPASASNTVTDEEAGEAGGEAVNDPGTEEEAEMAETAKGDTEAPEPTDAQLFSCDPAAPEASAGLGDLLDIGTPAVTDVFQTPSTFGEPSPDVMQPTAAQPDQGLFGLSDPAVALDPVYPGAPPAAPEPAPAVDGPTPTAPVDIPAGQSMNPFQQPFQQPPAPINPVLQNSYSPGIYTPPAGLSASAPGGPPQDPTMGLAPSPRQDPSFGLTGFQKAQPPAANPSQGAQMASAPDSGAVLSTTSAPVPSAASPESQLSTFASATTGGLHGGLPGAYNTGGHGDRYPGSLQMPQDLPQGMQGLGLNAQLASAMQAVPSQQQTASLNPFAAAGTGPVSPAGGYGGFSGTPVSSGLGGGPTGGMPAAGLTGGPMGSGTGSSPYTADMTGGATRGMSGSAPQFLPQYSGGGTGGAFASVVTGGSTGAAGAAGVSAGNPFAAAAASVPLPSDTRVPLDTTSTAALMAPLTYSADRDRLLYLGKGVLFEDSCLQVGFVAAPPDKASGSRSITLFCGNKLENSHLADFHISLSPSSSVPSLALTDPPSVLSAYDQQRAAVIARGVGDVGSDPAWANSLPPEASAAISYTYPPTGQRTTHRVEIPLVRGSFATPADHVSQAAFFGAWARLTGGGSGGPVASGMARLPAPIASGDALSAKMLKLGFSDGGARLDPTSVLNYAGESVLAGGAQALARVEVNPADCAHINVTVVSSVSAAVSEEVRSWVVGGLSFLSLVP